MTMLHLVFLLALLMLSLLAFWPVAVSLLMAPLEGLMDSGIWNYLVLVLPFALSVLTLISFMRYALKTSLRSLMWEDGERKTERKTASYVFIVLLGMLLLSIPFSKTVERSGYPGALTFLSLAISLFFIPLQVLSEELMFRVIPARMFFPEGFGKEKWKDALFVLASGLAFLLLHARNPEVGAAEEKWLILLNYFLSGAALSLFAVMTKGFLTGIAYHSAVNLYVSIFVNTPDGVIPSYSFFTEPSHGFEATSLLSTVMAGAITICIIMLVKTREREKR